MRGAKLLRIMHAVGEDQAAFCVGVEHLNRLPGHGRLNVARLLRAPARHVFRRRHNAEHLHRGLQRGQGVHHTNHRGATGHVVLHFLHAIRGLDGNPPGIKGNGFANQANDRRARLGCGRIVRNDDHARRFHTALRDAEKRSHFQFGDFLFIENRNGKSRGLGHRFGFLRQDARGHFVRRLVHQIAGKILRIRDDAALGDAFFPCPTFGFGVADD